MSVIHQALSSLSTEFLQYSALPFWMYFADSFTTRNLMKRIIVLPLVTVLILLLAACNSGATSAPTANPTETSAGGEMGGMDHDMGGEIPFDAMFIDGMIEHHEGAIAMAEQALTESERPEIRALAEAIIAAQATEIQQMTEWRQAWYPDMEPTMGMDMAMGDMEVSNDSSIPYDQRFIDAMISHHRGAIEMAEAALENAEHEEIKTLAEAIITAQEAEIAQMEAWRAEWFGS
jgi:uncharacterized protein (DUF305 family)